MSETKEDFHSRKGRSNERIRWSRIVIGCLLGIAFAVSLGCLRYFNAIHPKDVGIAFGLSIAEFLVCFAIAIFVEHRRLSRLRWRERAVEFERRLNAAKEADRWKTEVQNDFDHTEEEITKFKTNVDLRSLRSSSIDELKRVARKAVRDGYNSGQAIVRNVELRGGRND